MPHFSLTIVHTGPCEGEGLERQGDNCVCSWLCVSVVLCIYMHNVATMCSAYYCVHNCVINFVDAYTSPDLALHNNYRRRVLASSLLSHVDTYVHVYVPTHVLSSHTHSICTHVHTLHSYKHYSSMHTHTCTYTHMHTHTHTHTPGSICACTNSIHSRADEGEITYYLPVIPICSVILEIPLYLHFLFG